MTRSAYAVASALAVACPTCSAGIGHPCGQWHYEPGVIKGQYLERKRVHSTRRKAADEKRTAEVRAAIVDAQTLGPFEIPAEIPLREPLQPRVPDLCPDERQGEPDGTPLPAWTDNELATHDAAKEADERAWLAKRMGTLRPVPFFPSGAIAAIRRALHECSIKQKSIYVEWDAEYATVVAYVVGIEPDQTDAIMSAAIPMMPLGIGIDVRVEPCVCHEQSGPCRACHNPETCRDPACDCFPF